MCTENCVLKAYYVPGVIRHYEHLSKGQNLEREIKQCSNTYTSNVVKSWSSPN